ncbi:acyl-coenzyme A synthetase [Chlamydia felis Fe/C-56]|uniref:Acyl-coenzyme A synthetase n=1 Tax=Chlamydia felis (strain Fe/C-56) TaxID=264202 RepID=Q255U7_CHLFF|nr:AMP-binding protein [Chlamydia felis]BAE80941.1 acyl-coenzyme A synthetase [Chlamydia felis Fe/C-56]
MHKRWNYSKKRRLGLRDGRTVLEKFLKLCSEMTSDACCWDEQLGVLSYEDMRKAITALSLKVSEYPEKNIGIMMPSSAGAYIAYFAVLLAGKVPVMINWSQGLREMEACIELSHVKHILTSKQLVEHLRQIHGDGIEYPALLIYMETIRKHFTLWDKIRIAFYLSLPYTWVIRLFNISGQNKEDCAVILFTSGTEKLPKGVPLTHANLIANQEACLKFFNPLETDIMMSFLPPFHAYGFNCCALFPILAGLPVVFSYNPLQPKKIVELIDATHATFLGGTPIFFDYILKTAKKQGSSLSSLRLAVIGGDAFKDSLRNGVQKDFPHIVPYQGYGTTECSPVITINNEKSPKIESCVGIPIDGMDVMVVSEETYVPVSSGEVGVILIRGTSLFSGYLGNDPTCGFVRLGGELWYVTGDLGCLDNEGQLFLKGRLSRFVKIGSEMISLQALESLLIEGFGLPEDPGSIPLVVCGIPGERVKLCLFTTFSTDLNEVNDILKNLKTSSIMKISYQHQVESIPMLGTGKPDYRALNSLALSLFQGD